MVNSEIVQTAIYALFLFTLALYVESFPMDEPTINDLS